MGFVSDDSVYCSEANEGESWANALRHTVEMTTGGRFLPAHFLFITSLYVSNELVFRFVSIIGVVIASIFFAVSVKSMSGLRAHLVLKIASACLVFIQLRTYHDPVLSFGLLIPAVIALNASAVVFLWAFLKTGSRRYGVALVAAWSTALLTYELSFGFLPFLLWLTHPSSRERRWLTPAFLCIAAPAAAVALGAIVARLLGEGNYEGTVANLDLARAVRTGFFQIAGSIPLMTNELRRLELDGLLGLTVVASGFTVAFLFPLERCVVSARTWVFLGLSWVLPGLAIAFSAKYQGELGRGVAYLPVLLSTFALGSSAWLVWSMFDVWGRRVIAAVLVVLLACVWRVNINVSNFVAAQFTEPRRTLTSFLAALPRDALRPADIVSFRGNHDLDSVQPGWGWYSWESPHFLERLGHHVQATLASGWFRVRDGPSVLAVGQEESVLGTKAIMIWYGSTSGGRGFLLMPVETQAGTLAAQAGRLWCGSWRPSDNSIGSGSATVEFLPTPARIFSLPDTGAVGCFESTGASLDELVLVAGQQRLHFMITNVGLVPISAPN
ncbi:MAG: hypothetical protein Q8N26_28980 [Myxococcales bacterium]|nr:hypothetical protein [Myxococcales bacterium]